MTIKAWLLCRISDKDQIQGDSLENQEREGRKLLEEEYGLLPHEIKVFREIFSGRKDFRPVFDTLMAFSKEHQKTLQYGCIFDIDRFSRAGAGFYEVSKNRLKKLGIQLIDAGGVIQPERNMLKGTGGKFGVDFEYEWSRCSPSETAEIQRAQQAKEEVRKILLRIVRNQIKYVQDGFQGRKAPYGFRNIKILDLENGKKRAVLEIEPTEASYLAKMYTYGVLIQQGVMTTRQACEKVNAMGYRSREKNKWNDTKTRVIGKIGGKKLEPKQFWAYLKNPNNAGFNCEKWTNNHLVKSKSPRLIDIDIWNKANAHKYKIIKDKESPTGWRLVDLENNVKRTYKKVRSDFPYKGLICCPKCKKTMTAGLPTGKSGKRFPLYFCNRGHKQISINPNKLNLILAKLFKKLSFTKEAIKLFEVSVKKHLMAKLKDRNQFVTNIDEQVNELKKKAEGIYKKLEFLTNRNLIIRCEKDYEKVLEEIALLESGQTKTQYTEQDIIKMVDNVRGLIEHLDKFMLKVDNQTLLAGFWTCIFPTLPTLSELEARTPQLSLIVRLKDPLNNERELWCKIEEQSRTLFDEIVRWNGILTKLDK